MITPNFNKLSILIPAYNESESIIFILDKVLNVTYN
jgi:glycosyltransferase involved in cell wall biosynthesis